jgi:aldehyde:ferredoxin oxidoreductase
MKPGKMLVVDLGKEKSWEEEISPKIMGDYIGGRGLGAYILFKNIPAKTDPLGPENPIVFSVGPAEMTNAFYGSRVVMNCKSPLTNIYLFTMASGTFGHSLKSCGFDVLIIKGQAATPMYLWINNNKVEFKKANHLWGKTTDEAHNAILKELDRPGVSIATIGPAGEMKLPYSAVITGGDQPRSFGRGGPGAVMGSKKLKAVALAGDIKHNAKNLQAYKDWREFVTDQVKKFATWAENRRKYGTGADVETLINLKIMPTYNWQSLPFRGDVKNLAPMLNEAIWPRKNVPCAPYCPSPCSHIAEINDGLYKGARCDGPEYETFYAMGTNLGIDDFAAIVASEHICDRYGLDTMSAGVSIGFAMECYEKGILTKKDTDGVEMKFGNAEALVRCVEKIGRNEGFGAFLGLGTKRMAEKIGKGTDAFAMHAKGLELGGYDCRGYNGQALQYALSSRGGCHHALGLPARVEMVQKNGTSLENKGKLLKSAAIQRIMYDSTLTCSFARHPLGDEGIPPLISALTGDPFTMEDFQKVGERILNLERMFNVREGIRRKDDQLPKRLLTEPMSEGPNKGAVISLEPLVDDAYLTLGWDKETGIPKPETLKRLGLEEFMNK